MSFEKCLLWFLRYKGKIAAAILLVIAVLILSGLIGYGWGLVFVAAWAIAVVGFKYTPLYDADSFVIAAASARARTVYAESLRRNRRLAWFAIDSPEVKRLSYLGDFILNYNEEELWNRMGRPSSALVHLSLDPAKSAANEVALWQAGGFESHLVEAAMGGIVGEGDHESNLIAFSMSEGHPGSMIGYRRHKLFMGKTPTPLWGNIFRTIFR